MNQELIIRLERVRLNLSHYFMMQEINAGNKVAGEIKETCTWATLVRKGYVFEDKLTLEGREIWNELGDKKVRKVKKKKEEILGAAEAFDQWWGSYPTTDRILDSSGSVVHHETRGLRTGTKLKCKEKYIEALNEGVYSHSELLAALKYEVEMRVNQSLIGSDNKLTFMKGSLTYLNNASYESFIEIAKAGKSKPKSSDTVII